MLDVQAEVPQEMDCEASVKITVNDPWSIKGALWSPRFPKAKDVGWWLVLGTEAGELLALKRVCSLFFCCFSRWHHVVYRAVGVGGLVPSCAYFVQFYRRTLTLKRLCTATP